MSAKKRSFNKTSNYVMSLSLDDFKSGSNNALGKVRFKNKLFMICMYKDLILWELSLKFMIMD